MIRLTLWLRGAKKTVLVQETYNVEGYMIDWGMLCLQGNGVVHAFNLDDVKSFVATHLGNLEEDLKDYCVDCEPEELADCFFDKKHCKEERFK